MSGTARSLSFLLNLFRPGQGAGSINPQDVEDFIQTIVPSGATLTGGSSIVMTTTVLIVNKTSGSATAVTLPASPVAFTQTYTVKDGKGDAATNNITITPSSGLVDGSTSFIININFMSVSFLFDGTNYWLV